MFSSNIETILKSKYGIELKKYRKEDQLDIIKRLIAKNDKEIDIKNEKINLLRELIVDMSNYINGGGKVATK